MSRSVIEYMRFPTENAFKCCAKLRAKYGVNDGVECRIEPSQPLEKADHVVVEVPRLENGHK